MLTKNKTEISSTPGSSISAARDDEHIEDQRAAAEVVRGRALAHWENEGGAGPEMDPAATRPNAR